MVSSLFSSGGPHDSIVPLGPLSPSSSVPSRRKSSCRRNLVNSCPADEFRMARGRDWRFVPSHLTLSYESSSSFFPCINDVLCPERNTRGEISSPASRVIISAPYLCYQSGGLGGRDG